MNPLQKEICSLESQMSSLLAHPCSAELFRYGRNGGNPPDRDAIEVVSSVQCLFLGRLPVIQRGMRNAITLAGDYGEVLNTSTESHSETSSEGEQESITPEKLAEWKYVFGHQVLNKYIAKRIV